MNERHDDLQEIIDAALREMAAEEGDGFDPQACNLAEFCRRTGLTRSRARTVRAHGFRALPHGNSGRRAAPGVLAGHTGLVDDLLRKGVTNSQVIFERLLGQGYAGGLTTVKTYIAAHRDLVPAKRRQAAPQGCRGQRFRTAPGEAYQMDWGFVAVERPGGERARIACFAMVCHHCGGAHVEFFPNARQENLLIGMLHAFSALGVPATVLTDNMKSVVVRRDADGRPVWQADYAEFMGVVGFRTRLCRPRHPYTKGKVERLVRFVKGNFLAGRSFTDLDALNREAALASIETLLRLSRLPRREPKTFEGFDFSRIQGRDAAALGKLPSLADLYAHRNVAFVGPGGIGKTHLAQAYGRECCMRGLKTYYIKATELRDRFQKAVQRGNTSRVVSSLVKPSCLIVDEVGRCVYDRPCTDLFFDVVDRRYEKGGPNAMVLTSNIAPSGWDEFFTGDDTLLCALDRLFDKASVFVMRGPSYRGRELDTYSVEAVPQAVKVRGIQPEGM